MKTTRLTTELPPAVKAELKALGFDGTSADLAAFEAAKGLPADGLPDDAALKALATTAQAKTQNPDLFIPGMKDDRIARARQELNRLGFDAGAGGAVLDQTLAEAIKAFKEQHPELGNVGRYLGAPTRALLDKASGAQPPPPVAPPAPGTPAKPGAAPRSLVLGEISTKAWESMKLKLTAELKSGKIPKGTVISVGSYDVSESMAKDLKALEALGAKVNYTPAFSLVQKDPSKLPWSARRAGVAGDVAHDGQVPAYGDMKTDAERYAWGKEIGQRFRDQLDAEKKKGTKIDGWMLDEIWSSSGKPGPEGQGIRELMRGVLDGLSQGRDGKPMKGIAYLANLPSLVKVPPSAEMTKFWASLNGATSQVVQEEYPIFGKGVAGAKANAANANAADAALAKLGPDAARIARKVVAGMTPGYNLGKLHGQFAEAGIDTWRNLGLTPRQVAQWRDAYIKAREAAGVVGLGEYAFVNANADPSVIDPVLEQVIADL